MPIPNYQDCILPLLETLGYGKDCQLRTVASCSPPLQQTLIVTGLYFVYQIGFDFLMVALLA